MAKITGPLFSVTAEGTFAGALTFSQRTSGQQVRYQRGQVDYENAARKIVRDAFKLALILWRALPAAEKAYWVQIESEGYADV